MSNTEQAPRLVSIVIVNYKVPVLLRECLLSLRDATVVGGMETIVVDNNSDDESQEMVEHEFPHVIWIGLKSNIGFGKACNVGANRASGKYLLFLNPDTVVAKDTLTACVSFMESHPNAGVVGPRILNPNGSLQVSCRRSFPTPMVAFYRFSGLSHLFPRSKVFGRYNLTYMDPDQTARVDAVSGSFLFMVQALFEELGGFDERFFMYGEDLDLCRRVHECGKEVWYNPTTQIVHFKGKSSSKRAVRSRADFYQAMVLFSRKYRHTREAFLPGWLVYAGIMLQAGLNLGTSVFRSLAACAIDILLINVVLWLGLELRFTLGDKPVPYESGAGWLMAAMHFLLTDLFLFTFWYRGVYARGRYSTRNTFMSGLFASVGFMACVYFINRLAFSRIAFAGASLALSVLLPGWRILLPRMLGGLKGLVSTTGSVVVIGSDTVAERLVANVERDRSARIVGIVWPGNEPSQGAFLGYPVLGSMGDVRGVLERHRPDVLLIATSQPWYSYVIEGLASTRIKNLTIRWVPYDRIKADEGGVPEQIPLQDFSV